jgi:sugar lactone lactonase YvrE
MKTTNRFIRLTLYLFGFTALSAQEVRLTPVWETDSLFGTPESAAYYSLHNCIYISNFNDQGGFRKKPDTIRNEFISKIDPDGNIIALHWVDSLLGPTGIAIFKDKLYIVERGYLTLINIDKHAIEKRIPIPGYGFPNDIAIGPEGTIYISDSERNCIYRFTGNEIECWLRDSLFAGLNGLLVDGQRLIVGNSNENTLLTVNLADKSVTVMAKNVNVIVDGIILYNNHMLTSGKAKIVSTNTEGKTDVIAEAANENEWYADFYLIQNKNLLVVPTLFTNRVVAFRIE